MLHLVWMFLTGFVIGLLARALMPGADHMGIFATALLGIAGSLVGGFVVRLVHRPDPGSAFHPAGFVGSIVGALILLYLAHLGG
jgi:uncharacterized membrane protein YeaQ/YmgE (transglycosylase-associated protein family)